MKRGALCVAVAVSLLVVACGDDDGAPVAEEPTLTGVQPPQPTRTAPSTTGMPPTTTLAPTRVEVIERFPHDPTAFTQGLELIAADTLLESTGLRGESTLRTVDVETGEPIAVHDLDPALFGEGATIVGDRVVQLTYQAGEAIVYELEGFAPIDTFAYETEGWGLCNTGDELAMSDGSAEITRRDPETFEVSAELAVTLDGAPLAQVNELECVGDDIWANIHTTDTIVRIDGDTGEVTATVDASGLLTDEEAADAGVLNGIAYDAADGTFLITGKNWPWLYRVRFVP